MVSATEPPGAIALFDYGTGLLITQPPRAGRAIRTPPLARRRFGAFQGGRSTYQVSVMGGRPKRIVRRGTQPSWGR